MKPRVSLWIIAILCATVALNSQLIAQNNPQHHPRHQHYKLYDVGTFGGPNSEGSFQANTLSTEGFIGFGDTALSDPFYPNCFIDCYVAHAFLWRHGHAFDLGALPGSNGGNSSVAWAINNSGLAVGLSEDGNIDPATGYPSIRPVAWLNGHIFKLGGFGGTQSFANMVNDRGQIVGASSNTVPDPYAYGFATFFPSTTQVRAFVWEHGWMRDIGTLGGPDATPVTISQSGLVVGFSYTSFTPNPDSGIPTLDPFLWDGRRMIDLGGFGGTWGEAEWVNNKGQVVGYSDLPGDELYHAFLWDRGVLTDLRPLPGNTLSYADWINEAGVIAGSSGLPDGTASPAVLWDHGKIVNLGVLPGDDGAQATSINNAGQVVGLSCPVPCDSYSLYRGFLWENRDMVDLNALVQAPVGMVIAWPQQIDDRGQIAAVAVLSNGDTHAVVLMPDGDCDSSCEQRIVDNRNNPVLRPMNKGLPITRFGKRSALLRNPFGPRNGVYSPQSAFLK